LLCTRICATLGRNCHGPNSHWTVASSVHIGGHLADVSEKLYQQLIWYKLVFTFSYQQNFRAVSVSCMVVVFSRTDSRGHV